MKHKVSELEGALLDAAVARAVLSSRSVAFSQERGIHATSFPTPASEWGTVVATVPGGTMPFSTDWSYGGPILERERIAILPYAHEREYEYDEDGNNPRLIAPGRWWAEVMDADEGGWIERCPEAAERAAHGGFGSVGRTPLVAAMRAYVASKFGDEVEL